MKPAVIPAGKERDDALVAWIASCSDDDGYGPTVREVADQFMLESTSTAFQWLERLKKEKRLTWTPGKARTLKVVGDV